MITTNDCFYFLSFSFIIVFWMASLCVIVPITSVSAESTSFLQEIESLEDEYFALIETVNHLICN
jgi:hypothetical protein